MLVRGSSIGSKNKPKDVKGFYEYINSFKEEGKDAHFYEAYTELTAGEEKGKLGPYYCMNYKEGEKLNEEEMKLVEEKMKIAFEYSEAVDALYGSGGAKVESKSDTLKEEIPVVEDDEGEIDVKDIPF